MKRHHTHDDQDTIEFYKKSKHSPQLQARLNAMKRWSASRLEAALPSWCKRHLAANMPATFTPQFSQKFPNWTTRRASIKHRVTVCRGGPLNGERIELSKYDGGDTLTFALKGETGYYTDGGKWRSTVVEFRRAA